MQERAETTRKAVLVAAARLFEEYGYAGTSISDVARSSGYTSGALYFHFGSKEDLARSVVEAHFAHWPPVIAGCLRRKGTALERLVLLSFEVAREFRDNLLVRAGNRLWNERQAISTELPLPFVGWIATVGDVLTEARDAGELNPALDVPRTARTVIAAFFGTHTVSDALCRRADVEDAVADMWRLLLPAMRVDGDTEGCLARGRELAALVG
ncbi:TetR/AcrR family transcriptional regulator [Streptomyces roseirectus]|uniref:TetR/AcrR family transcriptional regulator n=1 Tax=Streptomyces roseirectus TaxID=2768066 RepID=A0A7H0IMY5_9ACTN|nr:ScbR family autoregulator-binding transcription factor [Streptomyces roseirectus]QNP74151.1 TetR/AcrR family transcriptional regulator [Streptomyces roseirectus]